MLKLKSLCQIWGFEVIVITSNKKHLESLKNDGNALIQTLESLAQTASFLHSLNCTGGVSFSAANAPGWSPSSETRCDDDPGSLAYPYEKLVP
ncbi:hypothetical protein BTVI_17095 [Pitangus sulphuratus]|nr:hypothetical protein BTVI_17095 [Pitangus sulphuratus]